jgi:hypothetical protein
MGLASSAENNVQPALRNILVCNTIILDNFVGVEQVIFTRIINTRQFWVFDWHQWILHPANNQGTNLIPLIHGGLFRREVLNEDRCLGRQMVSSENLEEVPPPASLTLLTATMTRFG